MLRIPLSDVSNAPTNNQQQHEMPTKLMHHFANDNYSNLKDFGHCGAEPRQFQFYAPSPANSTCQDLCSFVDESLAPELQTNAAQFHCFTPNNTVCNFQTQPSAIEMDPTDSIGTSNHSALFWRDEDVTATTQGHHDLTQVPAPNVATISGPEEHGNSLISTSDEILPGQSYPSSSALITDVDLSAENKLNSSHSSSSMSNISASSSNSETKTKTRKQRSTFTMEQCSILEQTFRRIQYVTLPERVELAVQLGISQTQVKTWFQNKRSKVRRTRHQMRSEGNELGASCLQDVIDNQAPEFEKNLPKHNIPDCPQGYGCAAVDTSEQCWSASNYSKVNATSQMENASNVRFGERNVYQMPTYLENTGEEEALPGSFDANLQAYYEGNSEEQLQFPSNS